MPAFKRFGPDDQIDNVLVVQPRYDLVSGSAGWRGSPNVSGALSLYGGVRRQMGVFSTIEYQSHAPNVGQTGNPILGQPLTSSVQLVYMTSDTLPLSSRTATRWGEEHWDVVQRLYQDYGRVDADYVTASYDHYCLYLNGTSRNIVVDGLFASGSLAVRYPTGSFCVESWVKPFSLSRTGHDYTVASFSGCFWFGLSSRDGSLLFTSSLGQVATSSIAPSIRRWNHVAMSFDSVSLTGTMFLNFSEVGRFVSPSASITKNTANPGFYSVGNFTDIAVGTNVPPITYPVLSTVTGGFYSFDGLVGETRMWGLSRTQTQLSASAFSRITASLPGLTSLLQFSEGPTFVAPPLSVGSGALDYATIGTNAFPASLSSFNDRVGPVWVPSDNATFVVPKRVPQTQVLSGSAIGYPLAVQRMLVLDVPSSFYGRQIVPGSVRMTCRGFESFGFIRTIVDDGRGGLYVSGSVCSSSIATREEYPGVVWNKVGNVFYGEGLVVIRDQSMLDFGRTDGAFLVSTDTFQLTFRGDSRIPVKTLMCRIDHGEFNCSTNPTFFTTGPSGERLRRHPSGSIRASTVGLYDSDRELVAVARLADPVRIRTRDRINIRLRIDF